MKPIGIVSIPRSQKPSPDLSFVRLMAAAGNNTGNLLFTHAVWEHIRGPKKRIGFRFKPETLNASLSALVFPAANWFGEHVDFSELADLVEGLDIPVILIGLGAQDSDSSGAIPVPEGTVRFVKAVADRSRSISVRGNYTREILLRYGIENVTMTGCPSLYQPLLPDAASRLIETAAGPAGRLLLHSTRYSAAHKPFIKTRSLNLDIFRQAFRSEGDILYQSEPEEISLLVEASDKPELDRSLRKTMMRLYSVRDWAKLEAYIMTHGHVFFDLQEWAKAMTKYHRAFGTRLHATIMALNTGVPAVLAHHDSRTLEMCEFADIPSIPADGASASPAEIEAAFAQADFRRFLETRWRNCQSYAAFLSENGLEPALTQPEKI